MGEPEVRLGSFPSGSPSEKSPGGPVAFKIAPVRFLGGGKKQAAPSTESPFSSATSPYRDCATEIAQPDWGRDFYEIAKLLRTNPRGRLMTDRTEHEDASNLKKPVVPLRKRIEAEAAADPAPDALTLESIRKQLIDADDPMAAVLVPPPFGAPLPAPVLWRDMGGHSDPGRGTVLAIGEVGMLSGPGEAGKSTVSLALAHAARDGGGNACGLYVAVGKVAVLSYEDSLARLADRMAWHGPPDEWGHVRCARAPAPLWETGLLGDRRASSPSVWWRRWWDAVAAFGPVLVVIDPASVAFSGASLNDATGVRAFLAAVTREAVRIECGVLIVAHDTKGVRNEERAGIGPGPGVVSGSGQWHDGPRSVVHMSSAGPGDKRILVAVKVNYGPSGWGARLAPRWDGDKWRGLTLDSGHAWLSREQVAAARKEWATIPEHQKTDPVPNTSEKREHGGGGNRLV